LLWKSKIPKKCPETDDLFMRVSGPFPARRRLYLPAGARFGLTGLWPLPKYRAQALALTKVECCDLFKIQ